MVISPYNWLFETGEDVPEQDPPDTADPLGSSARSDPVPADGAADRVTGEDASAGESLLVHTPFAVVGVDRHGFVRSVSGAMRDVLGMPAENYLGTRWLHAVHPDDVGGAMDALGELIDVPDGSRRTVMIRLRAEREDECPGGTGADPGGTGSVNWVAVEAEVTRMIDTGPGLFVAAFRAISDFDDRPHRVEAFLRSMIDVPLDALIVMDDTGRALWASASAAGHPHSTRSDITGLLAVDVLHPADVAAVDAARERVSLGEGPLSVEGRMRSPGGSWHWMRIRISDLRDVEGVGGLVAVVSDVNEEVEARIAMARFASVFDTTDDLMVLTDPDGVIVHANRAAMEFFGGKLDDLAQRDDLIEVLVAVEDALAERGPQRWVGEVSMRGADGELRPFSLEVLAHHDDDGALGFVSATARDISERMALQAQLERQVNHDPLTGLPNRALLFDRIHRASGNLGVESDHHMALLFIDLDHFKSINDNLGHSVGDQLLSAISRRVRTVVRPGDLVGRFGGDEFVVLCEQVESLDAATAVAARIAATLEAPFRVESHDITVGVSIGIAFADQPADAEAILRDADAAMYRAKSGGRGQWVVFDEELRRTAAARSELESDLRRTHPAKDMELHYQPIVACDTHVVTGVEALLRWRRNGELVPPGTFMQVAEETGLITSIGEWVVREACSQLARWRGRSGWEHLRVGVNVSARQVQRAGFAAMVKSALDDAGVDPGSLGIEVTETVLVNDELTAAGVLAELRGLGLSVAIDDFGTGYSSLTYLHRLPVDVVKLDRSFVEGIHRDDQKRSIVEAVVNLCGALGLTSVAEGVETQTELEVLTGLGCTSAQGNLLSVPLPVGELEAALLTRSSELVIRDRSLPRGV